LVEVDVNEHMPVAVDLGAASRKEARAERQRDKRGQRCPDGDRLELTQFGRPSMHAKNGILPEVIASLAALRRRLVDGPQSGGEPEQRGPVL
jgi:hypothetical protein